MRISWHVMKIFINMKLKIKIIVYENVLHKIIDIKDLLLLKDYTYWIEKLTPYVFMILVVVNKGIYNLQFVYFDSIVKKGFVYNF